MHLLLLPLALVVWVVAYGPLHGPVPRDDRQRPEAEAADTPPPDLPC